MKKILIITISALFLYSCNLDEELQGYIADSNLSDQEKVTGQISASYLQFEAFQTQDYMFSLQEHPSDEMAGPTRGADWDDGGVWRSLHLHTWNPTNPRITGSWEQTLAGLYFATDALAYNPTVDQKAEATFLRSFWIFTATDLFGQVPIREPGGSFAENPTVLKRTDAIDTAINELEAQYNNLPTTNTPTKANKYNAAMLLAKMYLNRGVYKATAADGTPKVPTSSDFSTADMDKVIKYCNDVISGGFALQTNYFDMFSPKNTAASTESILISPNSNDKGGELRRFYLMTLHYNQNPSGWNGFVALTDLYDKFQSSDPRFVSSYTGLTNVSGLKAGILVGQQYNGTGAKILDRKGNDLIFTKDFSLANSSEEKGMRVIKYSPDYSNIDRPANDFLIFRYSDALLMKAEAMARKGDFSGANTIVQQIRTARGATGYPAVSTLKDILDERARELYWEGWRRQDQIRFGTFLAPVQQKPDTSPAYTMIFPIPSTALSTNPNLTQNPGY